MGFSPLPAPSFPGRLGGAACPTSAATRGRSSRSNSSGVVSQSTATSSRGSSPDGQREAKFNALDAELSIEVDRAATFVMDSKALPRSSNGLPNSKMARNRSPKGRKRVSAASSDLSASPTERDALAKPRRNSSLDRVKK